MDDVKWYWRESGPMERELVVDEQIRATVLLVPGYSGANTWKAYSRDAEQPRWLSDWVSADGAKRAVEKAVGLVPGTLLPAELSNPYK